MDWLIKFRSSAIVILILAELIALFLISCFSEAKLFGEPIRQYANSVIDFSSQYSNPSYAVSQTLGKENVFPDYNDDVNAWSPATEDGSREFLELGFDSVQTVTKIEIYETWYPGGIDSVFLINEDGQYTKVYEQAAFNFAELYPDSARLLTIKVDPPVYNVNAIRIEINSPAVDGWQEIDAVAITGLFPIKEEE